MYISKLQKEIAYYEQCLEANRLAFESCQKYDDQLEAKKKELGEREEKISSYKQFKASLELQVEEIYTRINEQSNLLKLKQSELNSLNNQRENIKFIVADNKNKQERLNEILVNDYNRLIELIEKTKIDNEMLNKNKENIEAGIRYKIEELENVKKEIENKKIELELLSKGIEQRNNEKKLIEEEYNSLINNIIENGTI